MVEEEAVLLDLEGRRIMGLNATGSFIWKLLDGKRTVAEVAAALAERFQIAHDRADTDAISFLSALKARGLIDT